MDIFKCLVTLTVNKLYFSALEAFEQIVITKWKKKKKKRKLSFKVPVWKHKERDLNENLGRKYSSSAFQWISHTATTRVQYVLSFPQKKKNKKFKKNKKKNENKEETEHTKLKRDVVTDSVTDIGTILLIPISS